MDPFLRWLESTAFSAWVRESESMFAFPGILSLHTIGMGFVAGISAALALRLLGYGAGIPLKEMRRFMPFAWAGFWLSAGSGVALLIGYPTKALTNPVFYLKLAFIAIAVAILRPIGRVIAADGDRTGEGRLHDPRVLAAVSLACWGGAITAGRLLAYTYSRLMQGL